VDDPNRIIWGYDIPDSTPEEEIKYTDSHIKNAYLNRFFRDDGKGLSRERQLCKYDLFFHFPNPMPAINHKYCMVDIYEPHGWFWLEDQELYVIYGHETILIIKQDGVIVHNQHTR